MGSVSGRKTLRKGWMGISYDAIQRASLYPLYIAISQTYCGFFYWNADASLAQNIGNTVSRKLSSSFEKFDTTHWITGISGLRPIPTFIRGNSDVPRQSIIDWIPRCHHELPFSR